MAFDKVQCSDTGCKFWVHVKDVTCCMVLQWLVTFEGGKEPEQRNWQLSMPISTECCQVLKYTWRRTSSALCKSLYQSSRHWLTGTTLSISARWYCPYAQQRIFAWPHRMAPSMNLRMPCWWIYTWPVNDYSHVDRRIIEMDLFRNDKCSGLFADYS